MILAKTLPQDGGDGEMAERRRDLVTIEGSKNTVHADSELWGAWFSALKDLSLCSGKCSRLS